MQEGLTWKLFEVRIGEKSEQRGRQVVQKVGGELECEFEGSEEEVEVLAKTCWASGIHGRNMLTDLARSLLRGVSTCGI